MSRAQKLLVWGMFIIIIIYNVIDGIQTCMLIDLGAEEANIILKLAMSHIGILPALFLVKGVMLFVLLIVIIIALKN